MKVLVCGAGVVGAACAYYLALRGAEVVLIERTAVAAAASGKSGGFLARDWCNGTPQEALAGLSFALHQELAGTLPASYGYRPVITRLVVASERTDVAARARQVTPPWLDAGPGASLAVAGTLGDHDSTASLDPAAFTRALVAGARDHGARMHAGEIRGVLHGHGGAAAGVQVDGDAIEADAVVFALGPWTDALGGGPDLPQVAGLKGYSIVLEPTQALPAEALFLDYETADGQRQTPELVTRADGTVYLCGIGDTQPVPEHAAAVEIDAIACDTLVRMAAALSPALRDARVLRRQACYRPICADAMPLIGPCEDLPGAVVATAHNCWGMLNAPATGLAVSELVLDGAARSVDLTPFTPRRRGL